MGHLIKLATDALNSQFASGFFGAAFGAAAGAYTAEKLSKENERRKDLARRIKGLNTALVLSNGVLNAFVALKRQHVLPVNEELARIQRQFAQWKQDSKITEGVIPFHFIADLRTMDPPLTLVEELKTVLFERCEPDSATLGLYQWLANAVLHTTTIIRQRNEVIEEMRSLPPGSDDAVVRLYLGLIRQDGNTDARHPTLVGGMLQQSDDVIAFSRTLIEHLLPQVRRDVALYGKSAPKAARANLSVLDDQGIMPDLAQYKQLFDNLGVANQNTSKTS